MARGDMLERDEAKKRRPEGACLSSRTSLRASTINYSECSLIGEYREGSPDEDLTLRHENPRAGGPRIVQRAALQISRPEDILSACVGVELVSQELGLGSYAVRTLSHIVCELGQNLLRHAGGGTVTIAQLGGPVVGVEVFAQDQGPGIDDLELRLLPRKQSSGPPRGLHGVSCLADEFDVQSGPGGTHVRVVVYG